MSALRVELQLPNPYGCLGAIFETARVCVCVCDCVCALTRAHTLVTQSCLNLCNAMDVAYQARQEYWSGLPFPSPGDLPDPGLELGSLALQADSLPTEPPTGNVSVHIHSSRYRRHLGWSHLIYV